MHPVFETIQKLKSHLLTFTTGGVFLDINATIADTGVYADSQLDHVVVTNPDKRVCDEIKRLCTSRPQVHVLNIDITTIMGMILLQSFLSGTKLQMIFWRYQKDVSDIERLLRILNGLLDEEKTIHVALTDKDICVQYQTTRQIGFNASNVVFSDRGYECSTSIPSLTIIEMLTHMSNYFRYAHVERLSTTARNHAINLTPCERDLSNVHSIICMVSRVRA